MTTYKSRAERERTEAGSGRPRGAGGVMELLFLFVLVVPALVRGTASSQTFAVAPCLNPYRGRAFLTTAKLFPGFRAASNFFPWPESKRLKPTLG